MSIQFSVLIPAYNRERYIMQAVDSVLSQTFQDYEVIVVDDGSTDNTVQVLASYQSRIRLLRQSNQGPEVARNTAAEIAEGEYLVLLDSDDLLLPHSLLTYYRIIRHFNSPPVIIGAMTNFGEQKPITLEPGSADIVKVREFRDYLSKDVPLGLSSSRIVVKKSVFEEIGGLRKTTARTFHLDSLNLILKVGTYSPCILVTQPDTVAYRRHEGNTIRQLKPIAQGIQVLTRSERAGQYPGGIERGMERRALIGSISLSWSIAHCLRRGRAVLAFGLLIDTFPMVLSAFAKKLRTHFQRHSVETVIPDIQTHK